jgi:hypothetical protein
MIKNTKEKLIEEYGEKFVIYSNLWDLERVLTKKELEAARAIRSEFIENI